MTLSERGEQLGTDKSTRHSYLDIYEPIFERFRTQEVRLMELGIGDGASLKLWREWFPNGWITGIDNQYKKFAYWEGNFHTDILYGDQSDPAFLKQFHDRKWDFIIDDAGHDPLKQMLSFMLLWRTIRPGGYYIVEDIPNEDWARYWDDIPGAVIYRNHKNGVEDDILVIIQKPLEFGGCL